VPLRCKSGCKACEFAGLGAGGFVSIYAGAACVEGCLSVLSSEQLEKLNKAVNKITVIMGFIGSSPWALFCFARAWMILSEELVFVDRIHYLSNCINIIRS